MRDRDSQVPLIEQDIAQGASTKVVGVPSTGTTGSPGSGVAQVTGTGLSGIGVVQVSGVGTQVTRIGTPGVGSTCAGSSRIGTGLQDTGVGHFGGPLVREPVQTEGHEDSVPQEVTSGRRRPKWLQDTLKEAKDAGELKMIMRSKAPDRFCSYLGAVTDISHFEPSSFEEAVDQRVWTEAMVEEYDSIMRNEVWEVVPRPEGKSVVTSRWIYKVKYVVDGNIEKHKARFVAWGFSQVEGIDYDETFASVARYASIRTVMAIVVEMGWKIHQMDVKTAFLNGILEEEVDIERP